VQVGVGLAAVLLIMAAVTNALVRSQETKWLKERFRAVTANTIAMISSTAQNAVITHDRPVLQSIVDELVGTKTSIQSARFVSRDDFVMAQAESGSGKRGNEVLDVVEEISVLGESFGELQIQWNLDEEVARIHSHTLRVTTAFSLAILVLGVVSLLVVRQVAVRPVNLIHNRIRSLEPGSPLSPMRLKAAPELTRLNDAIDELAHGYRAQRELELRIMQSQKMEMVGRLAGGTAHNFNNALMVILGYTELLTARVGKENDPATSEALEAIHEAAQRATSLTRQMLSLTKQPSQQMEIIDPIVLLARIEDLLRTLLGESIVLVIEKSVNAVKVRIDVGHFESIFTNLLANAKDALPAGGQVTVCIGLAHRMINQDNGGLQPFCQIDVRDNGVGMDDEIGEHIFDPFFTTKEQGKGTGLGLSMTYRLVSDAGGWIEVSSTPGEGSCFSVFFPASPEAPPSKPPGPSRSTDEGGSETILVVEDEPGVRMLTRHILESHGYRVLLAADGLDGERIASNLETDIDLMLTDAILPGKNGAHLAQSVRNVRPELSVVYMSGYSGDILERQLGEHDSSVNFLRKPFTARDLLQMIRQNLAARKA